MLGKQTLDTIQAGSIEEIYPLVTNAALYMAAGGFLQEGNQLLSELWKYKLPHDRNTWLPDISFTVLWDAAGFRPEFIPFELQDMDEIERGMRAYIAIDRWSYSMPAMPWTELKGQDLLRKAFITAGMRKANDESPLSLDAILGMAASENKDEGETYLDKIGKYMQSRSLQPSDQFPTKETELEALAMLEKLAIEDFPSDEGLALGAELAARHGEIDRSIHLIKKWGKLFLNPLARPRIELLAGSRHVVPLLLKGVIADELELSEPIVTSFLSEATTMLDKRLVQGRSMAYGNLDWKTLLEQISNASISLDAEMFEKDVIDAGWIGFQGAGSQNIGEAEKGLGLSLPEDYKSFLLVSNGIRSFPHCNPELAAVGEINYLKSIVDSDTYGGLCDFPINDTVHDTLESLLSRVILISRYPDEQMVWLIAPLKEGDLWETWFFAYWVPGERRYPGFRYFMEHQLTSITKSISQI